MSNNTTTFYAKPITFDLTDKYLLATKAAGDD